MDEKTLPAGKVRKRIKAGEKTGEWQGIIAYRYETGEKGADGKPVKKQKQLTRMLGVKCKANSNEGEKLAQAALAEWRNGLIEDAAREKEEAAEAERRAKDPANVGVTTYITTYIDQHEAARTIEPSTVASYRNSLTYITRKLGDTPINQLAPADVRRMEAELTSEGYSSSTVGKAHRLLRMCMEQAVNDDVLVKNPTRGVKPPKRKANRPNALDTTTAPLVIEKLDELPKDTPATIAARIALYCGLRRGEICALRWADVDINANGGTMRVHGAIGSGKGGTYAKSTKTDRERHVPVPAALVKRLLAWKARQAESALALGTSDTSGYYVIGNAKGEYCSPEYITRAWAILAEQFEIVGTEGRIPTFHDLRHSYATVTIAAGVDVKTVAANMGHANAAMTLNVYASPDEEAQRHSAQVVGDALTPKKADVVTLDRTGTED